MDGRGLDYLALVIFLTVCITLLYAIIGIHDIPYEIAKKRKHPHQDAIHALGWISLFLMHVLWPFLWIWALLYKPERGWGMLDTTSDSKGDSGSEIVGSIEQQELVLLRERVAALERKLEPAVEPKQKSPAKEA